MSTGRISKRPGLQPRRATLLTRPDGDGEDLRFGEIAEDNQLDIVRRPKFLRQILATREEYFPGSRLGPEPRERRMAACVGDPIEIVQQHEQRADAFDALQLSGGFANELRN